MEIHRAGECKHFTGTQHKTCAAGIAYDDATIKHEPINGATRSMPCLDGGNKGGAVCPKHEYSTPEEIEAYERETERRLDCFRRGVSPCCDVSIDTSRVIKEGRYKGHGRRYCSKCGKLLFMV